MELTDRVVVITGAGSGVGEALALATAQAGARHVVVADRDENSAARVADRIDGTAVVLDVRNEESIADLVRRVESEHDRIDLFASNAGFITVAGLEESNDILQEMWEVHVMSHIYAARAVLPSMIARGDGYLLNVTSAAGLLTQLGSMAYSITKHAAVALSEWLAISHYHQGIRVSVVCPQAVATNILQNNPTRSHRAAPESEGGAASVDGILTAAQVAVETIRAVGEERFMVLPHPEVARYCRTRAADVEGWLAGMRRLQSKTYPEGRYPGDALGNDSAAYGG